MHEEIKGTITSGNACSNPVQNRLSSRLLSRNRNIGIFLIPGHGLPLHGFAFTHRHTILGMTPLDE
jgi:hypothetical protein